MIDLVRTCALRILLCASLAAVAAAFASENASPPLAEYRAQLEQLRREFGGSKAMPDVPFFLFGMGNRTKLVYRGGTLQEAISGNIVRQWPAQHEVIVPHLYYVELETTNRSRIRVEETDSGVWITEQGAKTLVVGTGTPVVLPNFSGFKYDLVLRVLHQEILINILDGKPLPNFLVYANPWRRDAAMMAICLQKTGNLGLIRDWVISLQDPYDHNNRANGVAENEADNLGQTLYLISLVADKHHPVVKRVLEEIPRFLVQDGPQKYIRGRSDFHHTPLYQTKWLKFGLRALGLEDSYTLPELADDYSSLFWWDYKGGRAGDEPKADDYPYLGWARDHFHGKKRNPLTNHDYPLSWEINASQADYQRMAVIDSRFVASRNSMPHSWHDAEMFLYLLEMK
jgi:hypothetical protein